MITVVMSNSTPVRDQLYSEGIALGDYVVNELVKSSDMTRILSKDVIEIFETRLREEVTRFRERALQMMQQAEFIDVTPIVKSESDTLRPFVGYSIPSPAAVSQPVIDLLQSMELDGSNDGPKRARTMKISRMELDEEIIQPAVTENASDVEKMAQEHDASLSTLFPTSVSEIKIVGKSLYESNEPFRIFGILESSEVRELETPRRKRRKELSDGYFDKDGNYQALIYGGYVQLCSGALEWPFKIAEVQFKDFYVVHK